MPEETIERKIYSILTSKTNPKTGAVYKYEVGELHEWEEGGYKRKRINLFMYPDTPFLLKEKVYEHEKT